MEGSGSRFAPIASSSDRHPITETTGPKISSRAMRIDGLTSAKIAGSQTTAAYAPAGLQRPEQPELIQWDTQVTRDLTGPVDAIGQPINYVRGYVRGPNFGKGTAATHYPRWSSGENGGRTFRVAMGVRFRRNRSVRG